MFNGLLSSISDNVFVATVYINEAKAALTNCVIAPHQFELLSVAINTGTNLPSVATPNGQAAFFILVDFITFAINSPFLWQNGLYGFTLHDCTFNHWFTGY